jgi:hypothetical protein
MAQDRKLSIEKWLMVILPEKKRAASGGCATERQYELAQLIY